MILDPQHEYTRALLGEQQPEDAKEGDADGEAERELGCYGRGLASGQSDTMIGSDS